MSNFKGRFKHIEVPAFLKELFFEDKTRRGDYQPCMARHCYEDADESGAELVVWVKDPSSELSMNVVSFTDSEGESTELLKTANDRACENYVRGFLRGFEFGIEEQGPIEDDDADDDQETEDDDYEDDDE